MRGGPAALEEDGMDECRGRFDARYVNRHTSREQDCDSVPHGGVSTSPVQLTKDLSKPKFLSTS